MTEFLDPSRHREAFSRRETFGRTTTPVSSFVERATFEVTIEAKDIVRPRKKLIVFDSDNIRRRPLFPRWMRMNISCTSIARSTKTTCTHMPDP